MTEPLSYRLSSDIARAVADDGLPRRAMDMNGSGVEHVLYLENTIVRSMLADDWLVQHSPLPTDPTSAEAAAALARRTAASEQTRTDAAALRQRVLAVAQSAVGVSADQITVVQLRALFMVILHNAGALDKNGVVRPLDQWI